MGGIKRRTHHEDSHAENKAKNEPLSERHVQFRDHGDGNEKNADVAGKIEAGLDDRVMLKGGTLGVRRRHCPVSAERRASREKGYLRGYPTNGYIHEKYIDEAMLGNSGSEAAIHNQEAYLERVDDIKHPLRWSV